MSNQRIQKLLTPDVEIILKGHLYPYYLDKEVFQFALMMQNVLDSQQNRTKGDSWKRMTHTHILKRLIQELAEVTAITSFPLVSRTTEQELMKEYVDIANFCLFGAYLATAGEFNGHAKPES